MSNNRRKYGNDNNKSYNYLQIDTNGEYKTDTSLLIDIKGFDPVNNTIHGLDAKYESEPFNYSFLKFIYWKLDKLSCVLVLRNKDWFKNNIGQLEKVWKIIEAERVTGFEHRAPVKKQKKEPFNPFFEKESQGCLLKFNKIIKMD